MGNCGPEEGFLGRNIQAAGEEGVKDGVNGERKSAVNGQQSLGKRKRFAAKAQRSPWDGNEWS